MSFLHVREEYSPVSLSEKKTGCPVNIRMLVMAYSTISGKKMPFPFFLFFFPFTSFLSFPFPLPINVEFFCKDSEAPFARGMV